MTIESSCAIAIATLSDWFKISRQFINQWKGKPKLIATCTRDFSSALSKIHGIATNLDWFIAALFAPAVIGRSYYFDICFMALD